MTKKKSKSKGKKNKSVETPVLKFLAMDTDNERVVPVAIPVDRDGEGMRVAAFLVIKGLRETGKFYRRITGQRPSPIIMHQPIPDKENDGAVPCCIRCKDNLELDTKLQVWRSKFNGKLTCPLRPRKK